MGRALIETDARKIFNEAKMEIARKMIRRDEPIEKIMEYSGLSKGTVLELQRKELQSV